MNGRRFRSALVLLAAFAVGCSITSGGAGGSGGSTGSGGTVGTGGWQGIGGRGANPGTGGIPAICVKLNCADQWALCNADAGICVACLTDADCPERFPDTVCLPGGTCGCHADSQCTGMPAGNRCERSLDRCGCDSDADCTAPGAPACAENNRCGCGSNDDCTGQMRGPTAVPVCDARDGACVGCLTDADCTDPNNPVCNPTNRSCYPCRTSTAADCPSGKACSGSRCQ